MEMTFSTSWDLGEGRSERYISKVLNECPKWEHLTFKKGLVLWCVQHVWFTSISTT